MDLQFELACGGGERGALEVDATGDGQIVSSTNPLEVRELSTGLLDNLHAIELDVVLDSKSKARRRP